MTAKSSGIAAKLEGRLLTCDRYGDGKSLLQSALSRAIDIHFVDVLLGIDLMLWQADVK